MGYNFETLLTSHNSIFDKKIKKNHIEVLENFLKENFNYDKKENKLKNIIHITGTNGKGSTVSFLRSILIESGYSVNTYTSPHLIEINERFFLNGKLVTNEELEESFDKIQKLNSSKFLTPFEIMTFMAVDLFQKNKADFNIFEVGLGGKFDATNIFDNTAISCITSISLDHEAILGNTLLKILKDKIKITRKNGVCFLNLSQNEKLINYAKKYFSEQNITGYFANEDWNIISKSIDSFDYIPKRSYAIKNINLSLKGFHQHQNAALAISVIKFLSSNCFIHKIPDIQLTHSLKNTFWIGRYQEIKINFLSSKIIIDGCHNEDGIIKLIDNINYEKKNNLKIIGVCAFLETKNISKIGLKIKDKFETLLFTSPEINSPQPFHCKKILEQNIHSGIFINYDDILEELKKYDKKNVVFIIFGSLYFIGDFLKKYGNSARRL